MLKLFLFFLISIFIACGPKLPPDISFEGKMAVRGTQVIAALRTTLPALKQATCQPGVVQPCLAPADTDKVVAHIQEASKLSQELALVLVAIDEAQTAALQESGFTKAKLILTSIQNSLMQASIAPSEENGRQKVVEILGTVINLLVAVLSFQ